MIDKFIKNLWVLLILFLFVTALASGAVTLSFMLMNRPSTLAFLMGGFMIIMTIFIYAFWAYVIGNQAVALLKEKTLLKKSKNRKK